MPETSGKRRINHTERAAYQVLANSDAGPETQMLFLGALHGRPAPDAPMLGAPTVPFQVVTAEVIASSPGRTAVIERETDDLDSSRRDSAGLQRARARARRPRRRPLVSPDVAALTLTVVIPAHNEEGGLGETLAAIGRQTMRPDRVIVVNDGSTDRTVEIARSYGAEVLNTDGGPESSGSKSKVVNYGLLTCTTDIVLNVDGDTVICDDFIERIKAPFTDPLVAVAGPNVQVWNPKGILQRGREVEYLLGQHLYRPIQNAWASPTVCPGAACAYRRTDLTADGGFPDGTIAEDMDFTWRAMLAGKKAVYVPGAECYAIDPKTPKQLRTQLWRWMSGYFQCIRTHWREVVRSKKILGLFVLASMWDVISIPLWLASPLVFGTGGHLLMTLLVVLLATDLLVTIPITVAGALRRGVSPWWVLASYPCLWVIRGFNFYYAAKAMFCELALVPCEWKSSLAFFRKGH